MPATRRTGPAGREDIGPRGRTRTTAPLLLIAIILSVGALYVARAVFIPIAIGLYFAILLWPLYAWVSRRAPRWLAALATAIAVLVALSVIAGAVWHATHVTIRTLAGPGRDLFAQGTAWLQQRGIDLQLLTAVANGSSEIQPEGSGDSSGTASASGSAPEVPTEIVAAAASFLTSGLGAIGGVLVVVALAIFLMVLALTGSDSMRERAEHALGHERARRIAATLAETSAQFRMTILGSTIGGLIAGTLMALWCWALGVPHPLAWGMLALLFNYVPNVGAYISGIPPTVLAFATLGGGPAVVFLVGLVAIEMIQGNLVEPLIAGRVLSLSPLVVLISLIFWAWLWGAPGALLCIPLTAALVVILQHIRATEHLAVILADPDERHGRRHRRAALARRSSAS